MMSIRPVALCLALTGSLAHTQAHAQTASPTLQKISAAGSITLGHRESSIPFSYYDDKQQVVGYSQEMMLKAVEAIKAELKKPSLAVKLVPVTSQNRIPLCSTARWTSNADRPPTTPSGPDRWRSRPTSSSSAPA
jgi:glutamate/aspartate transport system substrate-binding protein